MARSNGEESTIEVKCESLHWGILLLDLSEGEILMQTIHSADILACPGGRQEDAFVRELKVGDFAIAWTIQLLGKCHVPDIIDEDFTAIEANGHNETVRMEL